MSNTQFSVSEEELLEKLRCVLPGLSTEMLRIIWLAFRAEAARRLVERKHLDLGCVKIVPMPFRQNWKELVIAKKEAFHDVSGDLELLAFHRSGKFIQWSLECVPSAKLMKDIDVREYARKEQCGIASYSSAVLRQDVPAHLADAVEIVGFHHDRSLAPCPLKAWPDWSGYWILAVSKAEVTEYSKIIPSQAQANACVPSTAFSADKENKSLASNNGIRPRQTSPDPLQAEQPACTGAVPD